VDGEQTLAATLNLKFRPKDGQKNRIVFALRSQAKKTWPAIVVGAHITDEDSEYHSLGRSIRWLTELFLCPAW
jgi:hypothetical protein